MCIRDRSEYTFSLTALGRYLEISRQGAETVFSCTEQEWEDVWENYFDLHTDYAGIKKAIDPEDFYLQEAARIGGGIRILRQELWETIVTFIISQPVSYTHLDVYKRQVEDWSWIMPGTWLLYSALTGMQ